jgi:hypothetical protein
MPLPTSKLLAEEESSCSDSSCAFRSKPPATKRSNASSHAPEEDETSSVDTAELVRSILNPTRTKNTTASMVAKDAEDEDSGQTSEEDEIVLSKAIPQQCSKSPSDSVREPQEADGVEDSDANSVDTTELVRRILHPRGVPPPSRVSDRPAALCENAALSSSAPIPTSTIDRNPEENYISNVAVSKEEEDDFVLPEPSDSASSSGSSRCEEGDGNTAIYCGNARLPSPPNRQSWLKTPGADSLTNRTRQSLGSSSPPGLTSHDFGSRRHVNTGRQRYQRSCHSPDHGDATEPFQADSLVDVDVLENSAFGFSPDCHSGRDYHSHGQFDPMPQNHNVFVIDDDDAVMKDHCSKSNGIVRQGLRGSAKGFSPNLLQSATKSPYSQSAGILDEPIEKFSDDEEDNETFGFGKAATTALERWLYRSGDKTSRNTVRSGPCSHQQRKAIGEEDNEAIGIGKAAPTALERWLDRSGDKTSRSAALSGPNSHQQRTANIFPINRNEVGARHQSFDLPSQDETRLQESLHNQSSQPWHVSTSMQASGHSFPHSGPDIRYNAVVDMTLAVQPLRRRRIRDPSSRPLNLFQPSYSTKPLSFPSGNNNATAPVFDDGRNNCNAGEFRAPSQPRNDVFGGSGVGVGSYQISQQRMPLARASSLTGTDRIAVAVNNTHDEDASQPSRKRPSSRAKRTATTKRKKGSANGWGKRGRGNWKSAKKRNGNSRDGSTRNGPPRTSALWAGNSDDPELRHVGGAEMSF